MFVERRAGRIVGLRVHGHAGFAVAGKDIVCAAVSALVLSAAHGVRRHARALTQVHDDSRGDYRLRVSGGGRAAQAILEAAVSGVRAVARSYPRHVRVAAARGPSA